MTQYRRGNSPIPKPLKDYAVPLLALFLILIIIYSVFSGDDNQKIDSGESNSLVEVQKDGLVLSFAGDNTKVAIEYAGGDRKDVENNTVIYKGEKIIVKEGSASFTLLDKAELNLDKLGILKYKEDSSLYLESSNLWLKAINDIDIAMKFGNVSIKKGAVVNLNQNDVESTVYVLTGLAEVSNLAGINTIVGKGQKVGVLVQDASDSDVDLANLKTDLDDYFKLSDWFIKNSGDYYLKDTEEEEKKDKEKTNTGTTNISSSKTNYLSFDNISDEAYISSKSIDIIGKVLSDSVSKITLGDIKADIKEDKTFSINGVVLEKQTNDLIFRVYDNSGELLSKFVYTIYNKTLSTNSTKKSGGFKVTNFEIDASKFVFTSPTTSGTFLTYDDFVTFRGIVPKGVVGKIEIDGYTLKSFNGITWRYHASVEYNNMKVGTNQYEIKYFDKDGKLIFKNYYTIILKSKIANKKIISDEAKAQ